MGRHERDALDAGIDRLVEGSPPDAAPLIGAARVARDALAIEVPERTAERHLAAIADEARAPRRGAGPVGLSAMRPPTTRRARAFALSLAAAIAVTLMSASAVVASTEALPGDLLYPAKRAVERVNFAFHPSQSSRARLHMEFAERRLGELEELIARGDLPGEPPIEQALAAYDAQLSGIEGILRAWVFSGNEELLDRIEQRLARQVEALERVGATTRGLERALERAVKARSNLEEVRANRGRGVGRGNGGNAPSRGP